MPIKRRTPTTKRSARPRATPSSATSAPAPRSTSRFLSADEKRQLILAHAAAHRPLDPVQRMSMWAGIATCLLFVVLGWAYTVGNGIKHSIVSPLDSNLQDVVDQTQLFGQDTSQQVTQLGDSLHLVADRVQAVTEQQAVLDSMVEQLSASSTVGVSSTRPDLFVPRQTTTTLTTTPPTP